MSKKDTYHNELYYHFLSIEEKAYYEKINFVDRNKTNIDEFEPELRVEIYINYIKALFEVGNYSAAAELSKTIIERIVIDNVYTINGKDPYPQIIYIRALCHYHINQLDTAQNIVTELLKMDKGKEKYKQLLFYINEAKHKAQHQKVRATSISLFLLAGLVIALEILIVRPFYPEWVNQIEVLRLSCFIGGLLFITGYRAMMIYKNKSLLRKI